ncbi:MAG: AI-2E family transporter [Phycisphaerae bacterium]
METPDSNRASVEQYLPPLTKRGKRWVRFLAVVLGSLALFLLARRLAGVLTPIVIALALAYIGNPVVTWLEKRRVPRVISVSVGIFALVGGAAFLSAVGIAQLLQFGRAAPVYLERLEAWVHEYFPWLVAGDVSRDQLAGWLRENGAMLAGSLVEYGGAAVANTAYWISATVLIPLYAFFFLWRFNDIVRVIRDHLPAAYRETIVRIVSTIDRANADFFRGRVVVCAVVAVLTGLGWLLVGVPYSLPLGLLAGVLNLVPLLSSLALPPALLFTYLEALQAQQNWVIPVCLTMGVYMVVQATEAFALAPYVNAHASGLHPVTTVIALLVGAELAGVLGMLLSIPFASTLKSLLAEYALPEIRRLASAAPPATEGGPAAAQHAGDAKR